MEDYKIYSIGLLVEKKENLERKLQELYEDVKVKYKINPYGVQDIHEEMQSIIDDLTNVIMQIDTLSRQGDENHWIGKKR